MNPSDLESLVLKVTPIGTVRKDVEHAISFTFRRTWEVTNSDSVGNMSQHNYHVSISDGDYYFVSTFATFGIIPKVATVKFLFDKDDKLKDVLAIIREEAM